jgi:hypothetical protein
MKNKVPSAEISLLGILGRTSEKAAFSLGWDRGSGRHVCLNPVAILFMQRAVGCAVL